jgi:F-type H+-transporting ATPase subunit delta
MRNSTGSQYAKSILAVAKKLNAMEDIMNSLNRVESWLKQDARFRAFLQSKKISSEQKKEILQKTLSDWCHAVVIEFLVIVSEDRNISTVRQVCTVYQKLAKEELGIVSVHAEVAEAVNESDAASLKLRLDEILGKNSDLTIEVNPDLLGGIKLRVEDTYLDASLQHQLKRMRDTFVSS